MNDSSAGSDGLQEAVSAAELHMTGPVTKLCGVEAYWQLF